MKIFNTLVIFVQVITVVKSRRMHPLSDEFIDFINSNQSLWRAGRNFPRNTPLKYIRKIAGTIKTHSSVDHGPTVEPPRHKYTYECLPYQFDARDKWKNCSTIRDIRDQGACGSAWAIAVVSAMSDRLCIRSKGRQNVYLSEYDVMTCCTTCGSVCAGGIIDEAWRYMSQYGTVSGGRYDSRQGCKPYPIEPCDHIPYLLGGRPKCMTSANKYTCKRECQPDFKGRYRRDKRKIAYHYKLTDPRKIMAEIYENGPVTARFALYEDFINYKDGVYQYVYGKLLSHHAVKLLGWGEEGGVTYWLAANSWNSDWGDNGYFKIMRGLNHLEIEDTIHAGLFRV